MHSFCLTELVLPFAALAGLDVAEPLVVASPAQARTLFADAYHERLGGNASSWFRMACDKLRRTIPDKGSDEWHAWSARETAVVEAYEALLLRSSLIDFDGLVLAALQLVEKHEWVRRAIQAKYPVVVIDEYQDLGLPLHRVMLALLQAGTRSSPWGTLTSPSMMGSSVPIRACCEHWPVFHGWSPSDSS